MIAQSRDTGSAFGADALSIIIAIDSNDRRRSAVSSGEDSVRANMDNYLVAPFDSGHQKNSSDEVHS